LGRGGEGEGKGREEGRGREREGPPPLSQIPGSAPGFVCQYKTLSGCASLSGVVNFPANLQNQTKISFIFGVVSTVSELL